MLPKVYFFGQKALSCLALVFLCCWLSTSRVPYWTPICQEQINFVCLLAVECSENFQVQDLSVSAGGWRLNLFISLLITTILIFSSLAEIIPLHQRRFVENANANQRLYTILELWTNFLDLNFLDPKFLDPKFWTQIFWTRNFWTQIFSTQIFWTQIFWTQIFGPIFFGPKFFRPEFF